MLGSVGHIVSKYRYINMRKSIEIYRYQMWVSIWSLFFGLFTDVPLRDIFCPSIEEGFTPYQNCFKRYFSWKLNYNKLLFVDCGSYFQSFLLMTRICWGCYIKLLSMFDILKYIDILKFDILYRIDIEILWYRPSLVLGDII